MLSTEAKDYRQQGQLIKGYCDASLALQALKKTLVNQTVQVKTAQGIIQVENKKGPPSPLMKNVIEELIKNEEHIPWKETEGGKIKEVVTQIGSTAYTVTISSADNKAGEYQVQVTESMGQDAPGKDITMRALQQPVFTVKENKDHKFEFSVRVGDHLVLTENSPAPRDLQREAIEAYGKSILEGKPAQLAIMGTGSGKSWVIAGVTHALGSGIYIVPNKALADEMKKDAVLKLHGGTTPVTIVDKNCEVKDFEKILERDRHIILTADSKFFAEKAALLQNRVVLIDETHEHTFSKESIATLTRIKEQNAMLGLTGTPTGPLFGLFPQPLLDINVRRVMDLGGLREMYPQVKTGVEPGDVVEQTLLGYLGRDVYLAKGKGFKSPQDFIKESKSTMSEAAAIDAAIQHNRERASGEKNFLFQEDVWVRRDFQRIYQSIADGSFTEMKELSGKVAESRRQAEVEARTQMYLSLHPTANKATERARIDSEVKAPEVNIPAELKHAQQQQIAQGINAQAVAVLFGVDSVDVEQMQRLGTLNTFFKSQIDGLEKKEVNTVAKFANLDALMKMDEKTFNTTITEKVKETFPGLEKEQRDVWVEYLVATAKSLLTQVQANRDPGNWVNSLAKADQIDLERLGTTNITVYSSNMTDQQKAQVLDQLRSGLVMQIASDRGLGTGVSIPSVLSTQQVIMGPKDIECVTTAQEHGRNIRDKDRGAINQQVVSSKVDPKLVLTVDDVLATDSGVRLKGKIHAQSEQANAEAERRKTFMETRVATFEKEHGHVFDAKRRKM